MTLNIHYMSGDTLFEDDFNIKYMDNNYTISQLLMVIAKKIKVNFREILIVEQEIIYSFSSNYLDVLPLKIIDAMNENSLQNVDILVIKNLDFYANFIKYPKELGVKEWLYSFSDFLRENKEIVLKFVQYDGMNLQYASLEFRRDRSIVLCALAQNHQAEQYCEDKILLDELRNTRAILAVNDLKHASAELRRDREVVLAAVAKSGFFLEYAADELKNDREIVMSAVTSHGSSLQFASNELKNDRELVYIAVSNNEYAMAHASIELRGDHDFMLEVVSGKNARAFMYAQNKLRRDRNFILAAIKNYAFAIYYASEELRQDAEILLLASSKNPTVLAIAPEELKRDRDFMLKAVEGCQTGESLKYAGDKLLCDRSFILSAVKINPGSLCYAAEEFKQDREIILAATVLSRRSQIMQYCQLPSVGSWLMQSPYSTAYSISNLHRYKKI